MSTVRQAGAALIGSLAVLGGLWWGHQQEQRHLTDRLDLSKVSSKLVTVSGIITRAYRTTEGLWILDVGTPKQTVMISPNLGELPFHPRKGDQVQITARQEEDDQGVTYFPIAKAQIKFLGRANPPSKGTLNTIAQAWTLKKGSSVTLQVQGVSATTMKSAAGKTHLQIRIKDNTGEAPGVLWEGTYNSREIGLLQSGRELIVQGEVDFFRNNLSLIISSVEEAE